MLTTELKKKIVACIVDRACDPGEWQRWDVQVGEAAYFGHVSTEELKSFSDKIKQLVLSTAEGSDYFQAGVRAYHDGAEFEDCPDGLDMESEDEWKNGWSTAMDNPVIAKT